MKGSADMARRMSYEEQMDEIALALKEEIHQLETLPADEAKKMARKGLMDAGIVDANGNLTAPYVALRERYGYV